jgi:hypothetical protein
MVFHCKKLTNATAVVGIRVIVVIPIAITLVEDHPVAIIIRIDNP